jgi:hypothetical protein
MLDEGETRSSEQQEQSQGQALEPVEQESILFHGETIIAVRLADGHICAVLRWICESMKLQPGGQVRKIERTSAIAGELVRVRVQTKGGKQIMPAITLRGFSPWVLSINPGEVKHNNPAEEERIRALIVAYQEEAKDALYQHFVNKQRPSLPEPRTVVVPAEPSLPAEDAPDEEKAAYYEHLAAWALWKAALHHHQWRGQVQTQLESLQIQLESEKAVTDLIPEIVARLGKEKISETQRGQVRGYVKRLHELTGKPYPTIYDDIRLAFGPASYKDL